MIKLAIVGYGKMGKEIENAMDRNKFELVGKYDIDNRVQDNLKKVPDVAIEFSTPGSVKENIEFLASKKVNIVCGTTGWYDKVEKVKEIIAANDIGFIYASNFSIGMNIFFQITKTAGEMLKKFEQYSVSIAEVHHIHKLDKPSGTAIKLAEILEEKMGRSIEISSERIGEVFGTHKIIIDSAADRITLEHDAKSRRGFAEGALMAAEFIHGKKGFYRFEEIFVETGLRPVSGR